MSTKSHKAKTAKDWQLRLQRFAAGERFGRGERPGKASQWNRVIERIERCPAHLNSRFACQCRYHQAGHPAPPRPQPAPPRPQPPLSHPGEPGSSHDVGGVTEQQQTITSLLGRSHPSERLQEGPLASQGAPIEESHPVERTSESVAANITATTTLVRPSQHQRTAGQTFSAIVRPTSSSRVYKPNIVPRNSFVVGPTTTTRATTTATTISVATTIAATTTTTTSTATTVAATTITAATTTAATSATASFLGWSTCTSRQGESLYSHRTPP